MLKKLQLDTVIIVIVVIVLLLRLWGVAFGLPRLYDPDEWHWVSRALRMLHARDPNPRWFGNPGTTVMCALSAVYAIAFGVCLAAGTIDSAADFEALYFRDPTLFYLSGRRMIVLFGAATILAAYLVVRRLSGRTTGLLSAAVVAVSPLLILYSKLIRTDVLVGLLLSVSLWFCPRILRNREWRDYIVAGLVTGFAVATKYTAAIFVVSIVLAHLEAARWEMRDLGKHTRLLGSGVAGLAGTLIGSPFLFLDFRTALSDIAFEARPTRLGATGEGFLRNLCWYIQGPLANALSWVGLVLAGLGILLFLRSGRKEGRLVATFPILFLVFISTHSLRWERWIVAVIPFFSIRLARAITVVATWAGRRVNSHLGSVLKLGLAILVVVPLLRADIVHGQALTRPESRTVAGDWMLANLPSGSRVLLETNTPQLPKDAFTFFTVSGDGALVQMDPHRAERWLWKPSGSIGRLKDPSVLAKEHIQYVVMSNRYGRYLAGGEEYAEIVRVYERIAEDARLIYELPGYGAGSAYYLGGPRIRIYEIK